MNQLKAVVLEKNGASVTILGTDGSFRKIRYRKPVEIGAEIEVPAVQSRPPLWRMAVSIAAVFLLTLIGTMSWTAYQGTTAVAMISVDINPRMQLTLDRKGRVLQLESLNPDAERVLAGLSLKGDSWNQALSDIIGQSANLHYLNPDHLWVLVGYSPLQSDSKAPEGITADGIVERIESAAQTQGIEPKIAVYQMTAEERAKAQQDGLTLGEYALMNTAQQAGIKADANTVKNTADRVKLLDQPQVQEQLKKENRMKGNVNLALPTVTGYPSGNNQNPNDIPGQSGNSMPGNNGNNPGNGANPGNMGNQGKGSIGPSQGNSDQVTPGGKEDDQSKDKGKGKQKPSEGDKDEDHARLNSSNQGKGKDQGSSNQQDSEDFLKKLGKFILGHGWGSEGKN